MYKSYSYSSGTDLASWLTTNEGKVTVTYYGAGFVLYQDLPAQEYKSTSNIGVGGHSFTIKVKMDDTKEYFVDEQAVDKATYDTELAKAEKKKANA